MTTFVPPPEHAVEVMLDLETMGTTPYSPITAIGACRFEFGPMQAMQPFYQAITLESCMAVGLRPSASTIAWWMKQKDEARQHLWDPDAVDLPIALDAFTEWWGSRPDYLWGNSARFDCGILEAAYLACGKVVPWQHWNERDYRTMKNLPQVADVKLKRTGVHHNALSDAVSQAHHLRAIMAKLQGPLGSLDTAPLVDAIATQVVPPGAPV